MMTPYPRWMALVPGAVLLCLTAAPAAAKLRHSPCHKRSKLPGCQSKFHSKQLRPYKRKVFKDHGLKDEVSERFRRARGFYITPYYMYKLGAASVSRTMKRAHMNAVVLDVKDDLGRVLWPSDVELSKGLQKHLLPEPRKALKVFHDNGIHVIARVVCFKDSRLPYKRPDLGVRTGRKARRLFSAGANWIDQYSDEVKDYIIELVLELQELGFDEIQLDYIRFPKGRAATYATWLHQDKRDRSALITDFLERVDRALTIPLSVDVYGLTTLVDGDPRRLGQTIESMARHVEAISPMMYANGMSTYFRNNTVTPAVYGVIQCGLWRARRKAPNIVLRPYLQAYPNNVESFFGPRFIVKQVIAAERAGSDGFLFWNSTMRNGVAYRGLRAYGRKRLEAFGTNTEQHKEHAPGAWCNRTGEVFSPRRPRRRKQRRQRRRRKPDEARSQREGGDAS